MKYVATFFFLILLAQPLVVIVEKLTDYLQETAFQEWWVTLLWLFIAPITVIIVGLWKLEKYGE